MDGRRIRPLNWVGSSYRDYTGFPAPVQDEMGFALYRAQIGKRHPIAKTMKGFGGGGVVELVEHHDGDTYRTVYTVTFAEEVYVLHAFQKKSNTSEPMTAFIGLLASAPAAKRGQPSRRMSAPDA